MENEKNEVKPCYQGKTLSIIAIVVSIISIAFSAFTLGFTLSKGKEQEMRNDGYRMQMECPMRNMQGNQTSGNSWESFKPQFDRPSFESSGPSAKGQSKGQSNSNRQNNSNNQGSNNAKNGFDFSNFD